LDVDLDMNIVIKIKKNCMWHVSTQVLSNSDLNI
jgi:hypothetical protein